jgi:hypothetical protein
MTNERKPKNDAGKKEKSKPLAKAAWPDQKAREQMSKAEADCETPGKHSKNKDWENRW